MFTLDIGMFASSNKVFEHWNRLPEDIAMPNYF